MSARHDCRTVLSARWRATVSGPFFDLAEPPADFLGSLPDDYLALAAEFGGREGFLGETYLRLYRLQELVALNAAYEVPELLPGAVVFGSDGGGEAFAFPLGESAVIRVPFLPLSPEYVEPLGNDFCDFVSSLVDSRESSAVNPDAIGMEVHDKHPICLGGSPTDPENKVLVPVPQHAELCRFWNKIYRSVSRQQ